MNESGQTPEPYCERRLVYRKRTAPGLRISPPGLGLRQPSGALAAKLRCQATLRSYPLTRRRESGRGLPQSKTLRVCRERFGSRTYRPIESFRLSARAGVGVFEQAQAVGESTGQRSKMPVGFALTALPRPVRDDDAVKQVSGIGGDGVINQCVEMVGVGGLACGGEDVGGATAKSRDELCAVARPAQTLWRLGDAGREAMASIPNHAFGRKLEGMLRCRASRPTSRLALPFPWKRTESARRSPQKFRKKSEISAKGIRVFPSQPR